LSALLPIDKAIEYLNQYKNTGNRNLANEAIHLINRVLENTVTYFCFKCKSPLETRRKYCDECLHIMLKKNAENTHQKRWGNK